MGKLTDQQCKNLTAPGKYADGEGLSLTISKKGAKYWQGRYNSPITGKPQTASYGVYPRISLKNARIAHGKLKAKLAQGIDPSEEKKKAKAENEADMAANFTHIAWRWFDNAKNVRHWSTGHARKIRQQLEKHILPVLGDEDIRRIGAKEAVPLIQAINKQGYNETAGKCFSHIRSIYAYAIQIGLMDASPVAHIKIGNVIPRIKHTPMAHSIDAQRIGEILLILERATVRLPALKTYTYLQPMLLTRPSELREMRWDELDLDSALWTIPGKRMKMGNTHLVPLPAQAVALFQAMKPYTGQYAHVFTNPTTGEPFTETAARELLKKNGLRGEFTWHGCRHTGSTLLNEQGFNRDHIESQLSHADQNSIRGTYNHADYLEPRREMMQKYADYLDGLRAQAMKNEVS